MRLIKFITFSHKLHGFSMYDVWSWYHLDTIPFWISFSTLTTCGWHTLYFFDQMPRLLFFSLLASVWLLHIPGWHSFLSFHFSRSFHSELPLCGYYSRDVTIRGRRLLEEIQYDPYFVYNMVRNFNGTKWCAQICCGPLKCCMQNLEPCAKAVVDASMTSLALF